MSKVVQSSTPSCTANVFVHYEDEENINRFVMAHLLLSSADVLGAWFKSLKDFDWLKGWIETNKMTFNRGEDKSCL